MKISDENSLSGYVVFPSLVEQQKIAEILSAQDKLIALKEKLIEEKKRQKKALMQQLLTGKKRLPGFSGEWKQVKLGDICSTFSGGTPNRSHSEYYGGDIPWIKSGELNHGDIYDTEETLTDLGLNNSSAKLAPKGTLLIAMYGATAGILAFTHIDAAINQAILALIPTTNVSTCFIKESLDVQIETATHRLTQGGQPNFNASIIESFSISMPCFEEQEAISNIAKTADHEIALLNNDLYQEKQKKKALMQLLLTGIVRVNV
jgi:type I restriction enzyme S subunit